MSQVTIYHPIECPNGRTLAAIDFTQAWINRGWQDTPIAEGVAPIASPDPSEAIDASVGDARADRTAQLEDLYDAEGWEAIKELAVAAGITAKPEEGWKAAIPLIVAIEFP